MVQLLISVKEKFIKFKYVYLHPIMLVLCSYAKGTIVLKIMLAYS